MCSLAKLNVDSINNFFELIGNIDETKLDGGNNLLNLFDKKVNNNFIDGVNCQNYWIKKSRKLQKITLDIKIYLKINENERDQIDFNHVYQAAQKIGLMMHALQESLNSAEFLYCEEASKNILEIVEMERLKKKEKQINAFKKSFEWVDLDNEEVEQSSSGSSNSGSSNSGSNNSSPRSSTIFSSFSSLMSWLKTPSSSPESIPSPLLIESEEEVIKREEFEDGLEVLDITADLKKFFIERRKLNPEQLKKEILSLLKDKDLSSIEKYYPNNNEYYLESSAQFIVDCNRINVISYNKDKFFKLHKNGVSEDVKIKLGHSDNNPKNNNQLIIEHLISLLGQKLFNKVGAIVHQSHTSDLFVAFSGPLYIKIMDRNAFNGFETRTTQAFDLVHDEENDKIKIIARVIYEASILQNGKSKKLGFFGVRREITASIQDLIKEENPSTLEVREYISDLGDKKTVSKQLKSEI